MPKWSHAVEQEATSMDIYVAPSQPRPKHTNVQINNRPADDIYQTSAEYGTELDDVHDDYRPEDDWLVN